MKQLGNCRLLLLIGVTMPLCSEPLNSIEGFSTLDETSKSYVRAYDKRIGYCRMESRAGNPIPVEAKLLSFTLKKQQAIIFYLWQVTRKQCFEDSLNQLVKQLKLDPNGDKYILFLKRMDVFNEITISSELIDEELTKEEWAYVKELKRIYYQPFDIMEAANLIEEIKN